MEQAVEFASDAVTLRGILHVPDGARDIRPAIAICHGFGGNSRGPDRRDLARLLENAGYVVLRFDFRGCGLSGGESGRVICMEEVADVKNAITFLCQEHWVDKDRIGVIGGSLGGSVAIYAAATDMRVRACVASGAIGNGERRFRFQYPNDSDWAAFLRKLDEAANYREKTGRSVMLDRFDIVQIPQHSRGGLSPGARMEFPAETAISMLTFNPEYVVRQIAPRPLLLVHPRGDDVVPKSESEHLAAAAGQPCEVRIIDSDDHFSSGKAVLQNVILEWLKRYLPTQ